MPLLPDIYEITNISTATTTLVKTGAGHIHTLTINTTSAGTISLFDSLVGSGTSLGVIVASASPQTFTYDGRFAIGLTIVTAGASNITISYI